MLEEGIVREPADVDMGLILGHRLPALPRRHPPLVRHRGGRRRSSSGSAQYAPLGKRFEPTETLLRLAQSGRDVLPAAPSSAPCPRSASEQSRIRSTSRKESIR